MKEALRLPLSIGAGHSCADEIYAIVDRDGALVCDWLDLHEANAIIGAINTLQRILETAEATAASANHCLVHRHLLGEARAAMSNTNEDQS